MKKCGNNAFKSICFQTHLTGAELCFFLRNRFGERISRHFSSWTKFNCYCFVINFLARVVIADVVVRGLYASLADNFIVL